MIKKITILGIFVIAVTSTNVFAATTDVTDSIAEVKQQSNSKLVIDVTEIQSEDDKKNTPKEVPIPSALWLFGSALFGFIKISSRRRV